MSQSFPIATRKSPLALVQARIVQRLLSDHYADNTNYTFPILNLSTTGDQITDRALLAAGGKGLFTKELEIALVEDRARFAVHSMKDVPTSLPSGLEIAAVLEREDPRDMLLTRQGSCQLNDLKPNAILGTASIRRQAQALAQRPDLNITLLRGNVDTRLAAINSGTIDATFLARAGLRRLGRHEAEGPPLPINEILPAPAQGCICIEIRQHDDQARALLAPLNHHPTVLCANAERGFLRALDGSCRTPIAAYAAIESDMLNLTGDVLSPDGGQNWCGHISRPIKTLTAKTADQLGYDLGLNVKTQGGQTLERALQDRS